MPTSSWTRTTLFLFGNCIFAFGLYSFVFCPVRDQLRDQQDRIAQVAPKLEQARSSISRSLAFSTLDAAQITAASRRFVQGETANLLSADLLTRLRQIADANGVNFTTLSPLPEREWLARKMVGAKVEFSASNRQVADVLTSIERGKAFLFIRRAHISSSSEREDDDTLAAEIEIYGVTGWQRG
jgi:hypothetical protein